MFYCLWENVGILLLLLETSHYQYNFLLSSSEGLVKNMTGQYIVLIYSFLCVDSHKKCLNRKIEISSFSAVTQTAAPADSGVTTLM